MPCAAFNSNMIANRGLQKNSRFCLHTQKTNIYCRDFELVMNNAVKTDEDRKIKLCSLTKTGRGGKNARNGSKIGKPLDFCGNYLLFFDLVEVKMAKKDRKTGGS